MYVLDYQYLNLLLQRSRTSSSKPCRRFGSEDLYPDDGLFELQVGIAKRTQQLQQFLSRINLVLFDRDAAITAAIIRAQLEQQRTPIGQLDVLIARTAVALQATLITRNVGEFSRIPELAIVDWY